MEVPRDREDSVVHVAVVECGEEGWRHVEVTAAAAGGGALVGDVGLDSVAGVLVGNRHPLAAVAAVILLVHVLVEGDNHVAIVGPLKPEVSLRPPGGIQDSVTHPSAGTETGGEVGRSAGVGDSGLELLSLHWDAKGEGKDREDSEDFGEHCVLWLFGLTASRVRWGMC